MERFSMEESMLALIIAILFPSPSLVAFCLLGCHRLLLFRQGSLVRIRRHGSIIGTI
jgi:hypothetical protein